MNDPALHALLYPFETGQLSAPDGKILFINALPLPPGWAGRQVTHCQWFKPKADLIAAGVITEPDAGPYDLVMLLGTKQHAETRYYMARGFQALAGHGMMVCAAANNAGGKRLKKDMAALGFDAAGSAAKHKAQVLWGRRNNSAETGPVIAAWLAEGGAQQVMDGDYRSRPGLFGWNKIDTGSALLADSLPGDLAGAGADFGCGFGYLSRFCLEKYHGLQKLHSIDADARALTLAQDNLKAHAEKTEFLWHDLTTPLPPAAGLFDFIVMNPPFHEDKKTMAQTGRDFVETAARSLRAGGVLYMVANAHLPYEDTLRKQFSVMRQHIADKGYKVIHAVR